MKQTLSLAIFISVIFFCSCEPIATFDKPQPADVKSLTAFPKRIQGQYQAADQASILTISDKLVTRHYDFEIQEHKDSLSSSRKLVGDTLINLTNGTKEKIVLRADTIIRRYTGTDTLFYISTDNVVKKFKGYYFLNKRYSENAWEVNKISLDKGVLTIASVSSNDDIQKLKEITENSADTTSTNFSLTRRQFKKFIKQDGFSVLETFTRIKQNGQ